MSSPPATTGWPPPPPPRAPPGPQVSETPLGADGQFPGLDAETGLTSTATSTGRGRGRGRQEPRRVRGSQGRAAPQVTLAAALPVPGVPLAPAGAMGSPPTSGGGTLGQLPGGENPGHHARDPAAGCAAGLVPAAPGMQLLSAPRGASGVRAADSRGGGRCRLPARLHRLRRLRPRSRVLRRAGKGPAPGGGGR